MDPNNGIFTRSFDESLIRELPHLRIAPLREPVSSRSFRLPLTLEPNASAIRDAGALSKAAAAAAGGPPAPPAPAGTLPPLNEPTSAANVNVVESSSGTNPSRLKTDFASDSLLEPPPRPILPAFVNLRALERFPYSSFDDDGHGHQSRKRRRVDLQPESFGEHVQLPKPHAQKEQRPPPFGPFAILNGLNEPPPNAALLPPIEAGSITQLLTKPSRDSLDAESGLLTTSFTSDTNGAERREGRIADILDSPVTEKPSLFEAATEHDKVDEVQFKQGSSELGKEAKPADESDAPLSPKTRGRSRKNIRRWSDEETVALLRGVISCGIGNWKEILALQESNFNKRSASNLKDRFRVCCPSAYRTSDPKEAVQHIRDALAKVLLRINSDSPAKKTSVQPPPTEPTKGPSAGPPGLVHSGSSSSFSSCSTSHNSPEPRCQSGPEKAQRLSNKPEPALDNLGITEPYNPAKSRRRLRRPFTAEEDEDLLKGYAVHGFQWTLIQQSKELNLGHRRATDLRDRFRTKFPNAYREGGSVRSSVLQDNANRPPKGISEPQSSKQTFSEDRSSKLDGLHSYMTGVVEPVLPSLAIPPTARESSTGLPSLGYPFLDEGSINDDSVDLPPLIWDELT
ncbi:hypothetical protein BDV19DRAFT_287584 [Aspergillus venezuelensis]